MPAAQTHDGPVEQRLPTPTLRQSTSCWHDASKIDTSKIDTSMLVQAPLSSGLASAEPSPRPTPVLQSAVFTAVVHVPRVQLSAAQNVVHGSHAGVGQYVPSDAHARPTAAAMLLGHTCLDAAPPPSSEGDVDDTAPPHAAKRYAIATPTAESLSGWHNRAREKQRVDMFGRASNSRASRASDPRAAA